jgi:hypothetical protein
MFFFSRSMTYMQGLLYPPRSHARSTLRHVADPFVRHRDAAEAERICRIKDARPASIDAQIEVFTSSDNTNSACLRLPARNSHLESPPGVARLLWVALSNGN